MTKSISVLSVLYVNNMLRNVYLGMADKLKGGDITGITNANTAGGHDRYLILFNGMEQTCLP
ncbi:MAG: hypothetical protein V4634_11560 [Pseudomonadota bacterium]